MLNTMDSIKIPAPLNLDGNLPPMDKPSHRFFSTLTVLLAWGYTTILCLVYGFLIGPYFVFRYVIDDIYGNYPTEVFSRVHESWFHFFQISILITSILLMILCVGMARVIRKKRIDAIKYLRGSLLSVFSILLLLIFQDDPLSENKYSWNEVPRPLKNAAESYQVLRANLSGEAGIRIDRFDIDFRHIQKDPLLHEDAIVRLWDGISGERGIFDRLDSFDGIADLSTVDDAMDLNLMELNNLTRVYCAYAGLLLEKGRPDEAAGLLIPIYSVSQKALPYARYMIHKVIWNAVAQQTMTMAFELARHPNCDTDTLSKLRNGFKPFGAEQVSCRGAYISEYFFMRNSMEQEKSLDDLVIGFCDYTGIFDNVCSSQWRVFVLKLFFTLNFRRNKTANRDLSQIDLILADIGTYPPSFDQTENFIERRKIPEFGNTGAWLLNETKLINYSFLVKRVLRSKVTSDLLSIYLHERLGETAPIRDYMTGNDLLKTGLPGIYFSPGMDGKPRTKDDVKLS